MEWIAHHQAAGVTDFLIYSNDCDDGTGEMLDALDAAGEIVHLPQTKKNGESVQWQAIRNAWKHPLRKEADWILVSDVDEFLNIHVAGHQISDLLKALPEGTDAVALPWRLFGNNDIVFATDTPVTEQFTASAPGDCSSPIAATLFKSLIRVGGPFNQLGVHRPKQKPATKAGLPKWVDGSGNKMPGVFAANQKRLSLYSLPSGRSLAEMNHYSLRSAEAFLIKRDRGLPNRKDKEIDLSYWVERNFNTERNETISAMRPATEKRLEALHRIPGVSDLHGRSVNWHHEKFKVLITQIDLYKLFNRIVLTGSSKVLSKQLTQQLVRWYGEAILSHPKNSAE